MAHVVVTVAFDARKVLDYGVGTHIQGLLPELMRQTPSHVQWLVITLPSTHSFLKKLLDGTPSRVLWLQTRARPYSLQTHIELSRRLAASPIHLLHAPFFPLPARLRVPAILTVHDTILLERWPQWRGWWIAFIARGLMIWSVRRATRVVAVSRATAQRLRSHFPWLGEKVEVIPNGLPPAFLKPPSMEVRARWQVRLGLPSSGYILYVGNAKPHKNLDRLIEACAMLWRTGRTDCPLVLLGMPSAAWQRVVRRYYSWTQLGWIRWVPFQDPEALQAVYLGARLVVQPSLDEGFGFPVLEAMALGIPVACSRAGALPEVAGEEALFFDPRDSNAMAAVIERGLRDEDFRRRWTAYGQDRARQFCWKRAAREYLRLYAELGIPI